MKLASMRTQKTANYTLCGLRSWMGTYHVLCFLGFKKEASSTGPQAWRANLTLLSDLSQSPELGLFWATSSSSWEEKTVTVETRRDSSPVKVHASVI